MDLKSVKSNWEALGEIDPLWAILSDDTKKNNSWGLDEFFETGKIEIKNLLNDVAEYRSTFEKCTALDFGCGVGRLTQALCQYFDTCYGIDISSSMIEKANQYNQYGNKCKYIINDKADLQIFESESIDFIYSVIVLQHMEERYSSNYIKEFVRILKPNGILRFQIPSQWKAKVISDESYKAEITIKQNDIQIIEDKVIVNVIVKNTSKVKWPSGMFNIGNHWLDINENVVVPDDQRVCISKEIKPEEQAEFVMSIDCSVVPKGIYYLEFDLVHEGITWFKNKDNVTSKFRMDTSINEIAEINVGQYEKTVKKSGTNKIYKLLKNGNKKLMATNLSGLEDDLSKKMEMNGIKRETVESIILLAGGKLLQAKEDNLAGGNWESFTYTVTK